MVRDETYSLYQYDILTIVKHMSSIIMWEKPHMKNFSNRVSNRNQVSEPVQFTGK